MKQTIIAVIMACSLAALLIAAGVNLPVFHDFETSEGFILGDLNGQNHWVVNEGSAEVTASDAASGAQSVQVKAADPFTHIRLPLDPSGAQEVIITRFVVKPYAGDLSLKEEHWDIGSSVVGFFEVSPGLGEIYAFDGGSRNWIASGVTVPLDANKLATQWVEIQLRQGYATGDQVWDLYLDGNLEIFNLGYLDPEPTLPGSFIQMGHTGGESYLDAVSVGYVNTLFTDQDNDGIPDDVETANGFNASTNDRHAVDAGSGLTNLELYGASLGPAQNAANLPRVTWISPVKNAILVEGVPITLSAVADDSDGSIHRVEFYQGDTLIGMVNTAPYELSWTPAAIGEVTLSAHAYDDEGQAGYSEPVEVSVGGSGKESVTITITGDDSHTLWHNGELIGSNGQWNQASTYVLTLETGDVIAVEATNNGGAGGLLADLAYEFSPRSGTSSDWKATGNAPAGWEQPGFDDTGWSPATELGAYGMSPWDMNINLMPNDTPGQWIWPDGASTAYFRHVVEVSTTNAAPTVVLSAPAGGTAFAEGDSIALAAQAADADGQIASVAFYQNGNLLGSDSTAPFTFTWEQAEVGSHELIALATDDQGAITASAPVTVAVEQIHFLADDFEDGLLDTGGLAGGFSGSHDSGNPDAVSEGNGELTLTLDNAGNHWRRAEVTSLVPVDTSGFAGFQVTFDVVTTYDLDRGLPLVFAIRPDNTVISGFGDYDQAALAGLSLQLNDEGQLGLFAGLQDGAPLSERDLLYETTINYADLADGYQFTLHVAPEGWMLQSTGIEGLEDVHGTWQTHGYADLFGPTTHLKVFIRDATRRNATVILDSVALDRSPDGLPNLVPGIQWQAPADGSSFLAADPVTLTAVASDPDGTIDRVEFYDGEVWLAEVNSAPYTFTWNNAPVGSHSVSAIAYDGEGTSASTEPVTLHVFDAMTGGLLYDSFNDTDPAEGGPGDLHAGFFTSHDSGLPDAITEADGKISLSLAGADGHWKKARIISRSFFDAGQLDGIRAEFDVLTTSGQDRNKALVFALRPDATGFSGYDGYDTAALAGLSVQIHGNGTLGVFASLEDGAPLSERDLLYEGSFDYSELADGYTLILAADRQGWKLTIEGVAGLGSVSGSWVTHDYDQILSETTHTLVRIKDGTDHAATVELDTIALTHLSGGISAPNVPPTVSLTSPASGNVFNLGADIHLEADAADVDGQVVSVAFYRGAEWLGTDTQAPYQWTASASTEGEVSFSAIATDNTGQVALSPETSVLIHSYQTAETFDGVGSHSGGGVLNNMRVFGGSATFTESDGTFLIRTTSNFKSQRAFFNSAHDLSGEPEAGAHTFVWDVESIGENENQNNDRQTRGHYLIVQDGTGPVQLRSQPWYYVDFRGISLQFDIFNDKAFHLYADDGSDDNASTLLATASFAEEVSSFHDGFTARLQVDATGWQVSISGVNFTTIPVIQGTWAEAGLTYEDLFTDNMFIGAGGVSNTNNYHLKLNEIAVLDRAVLATADADEDGITDLEEASLGLNPFHPDSDRDHMADGWEFAYGLDPLDPDDGAANPDGDLLTNAEEYLFETSPLIVDTDGNGQPDGENVPGWVLNETWHPVPQSYLNLMDSENGPESHRWLSSLESSDIHIAHDTGNRIRGFIVPDITADYTFRVSGDDQVVFYLSPDRHAFHMVQTAWSPNFTAKYEWEKIPGAQVSAPVSLIAGKPYYFEIIHYQQQGQSNFALAWSKDGETPSVIGAGHLRSPASDPLDADGNGLEDAWETTHGLSASATHDDRHLGALGDFDNDGLLNVEEAQIGTSPVLADSDNDSIPDWAESTFLATDPTHPEAHSWSTALGQWQVTAFSPEMENFALSDTTNPGRYLLAASGQDRFDTGEANFTFFNHPVSGDFDIAVRLENWTGDNVAIHGDNWIGLMVRDSLDPEAPFNAFESNPGANFRFRQTPGEIPQSIPHLQGPEAAPYLRLTRTGGFVKAYYSTDGSDWVLFAESSTAFTGDDYLGLYVTGFNRRLDGIEFTVLNFSPDSDGDGLLYDDEIAAGTDPNLADTDGDGISDYDEIHVTFSDPLVPDLSPAVLVADYSPASASQPLGQWVTDGDSVYSTTVKAALDFTIQVPTDGVYRLEFETESRFNGSINRIFPVEVHIDGQFIDRVNVVLENDGSTGLARVTTPWITAGSHQVRFFYDNVVSGRRIQVHALRLLDIPGPDADGNGVADWVDHRLAGLNKLEATGPIQSWVSPYQVQGVARFFDSLSLNATGGQAPAFQRSPGMGFYADVDLDPDTPTTIDASFENGGFTRQVDVEWAVLNLLADPAADLPDLRVGSRLRLTAIPAGTQTVDSSLMTVTVDDGNSAVTVPVDHAATHSGTVELAAAGTYTLTGTYQHPVEGTQTASLTVEVVDGGFTGDPVVGRNTAYIWDNPLLPAELPVEIDPGLSLSEIGPLTGGGFQFLLRSGNYRTSYVGTRLEEDGEILDTASVTTLYVSSNETTGVDVLETYADGSTLIGNALILNQLPPDLRVDVEIFVSGVTFEDGSVFKTLTAEDFDEFNRSYLKFIVASPDIPSHCHRIHIYNGEDYLGTF